MPSKANQKCSNIFFSRKKPGWRPFKVGDGIKNPSHGNFSRRQQDFPKSCPLPHFTVINGKFPWLGFLTPSLISFNIQMEGGTGSPLINWKAFAWFATHYTGPYTAASVFYLGVNLITKTMTSVWSLQRWPNAVLGPWSLLMSSSSSSFAWSCEGSWDSPWPISSWCRIVHLWTQIWRLFFGICNNLLHITRGFQQWHWMYELFGCIFVTYAF